MSGGHFKDLTGRTFGRLTVVRFLKFVNHSGNPQSGMCALFECRCGCGTVCDVKSPLLTNGNTKSCGCLRTHKRLTNAASSGARHLLSLAKFRAKKQGIPFDLTVEDITIPEFCPILGIKLESGRGKGLLRSDTIPSLDKIRPELGYVRGNVWVISWRANRLKSDASAEELELIVSALRRRKSWNTL